MPAFHLVFNRIYSILMDIVDINKERSIVAGKNGYSLKKFLNTKYKQDISKTVIYKIICKITEQNWQHSFLIVPIKNLISLFDKTN